MLDSQNDIKTVEILFATGCRQRSRAVRKRKLKKNCMAVTVRVGAIANL